MKNINKLLVCSLLLGSLTGLKAQDIHFSQFYMSPLTQNPAMAGALYDLEALANYKDQWRSVAAPYKTVAVSYDMRLGNKSKKGFWAAGINFFSDRAGDANMGITQANLNIAYHVHLNDYNTLGGGLMGGFAQRSLNYGALQWGNQYNGNNFDASLPTGETTMGSAFSYMDAAAGIVWTYNNTAGAKMVTDNHDLKFNVGLSVFHPQQPNYSFYNSGTEKLYMKIVLHGNGLISIPDKNVALAPGFMWYQQGPAQELFFGTLIRYKLKQDSKYTGFQQGAAFSLGAYYRNQDAVIASMLLEYSNYAIGFSYDINTSPLRAASNARGGYEISLRFVNPNPFTNKGPSQSMF